MLNDPSRLCLYCHVSMKKEVFFFEREKEKKKKKRNILIPPFVYFFALVRSHDAQVNFFIP